MAMHDDDEIDFGEQIENSLAFREGLDGMSAHDYFDRIVESGILDGCGVERLQSCEDAILEEFESNPGDAFYALAAVSFDKECIEGSGPGEPNSYYCIIEKLAAASQTLFQPTNVIDEVDFDEDHAKLSFKHEGDRYKREFEQEENFFSKEALQLMNKALAASGCDERFISMPTTEQDENCYLAFTSSVTYARAIGLGVVPNVAVYIEDDR
jgi:hypothetical protein